MGRSAIGVLSHLMHKRWVPLTRLWDERLCMGVTYWRSLTFLCTLKTILGLKVICKPTKTQTFFGVHCDSPF